MAAPLLLQQFQNQKLGFLQSWPRLDYRPVFPLNGILDTFNRVDENPLANGNWTSLIQSTQAPLKIVSNVARNATVAALAGQSYWSATQFGANQEAFCDIGTVSTSQAGVWCRIHNPGNVSLAEGYVLQSSDATHIKLFRMTAGGTFTQIGGFLCALKANDGLG